MIQVNNKYNIGDTVYYLDSDHRCKKMTIASMAAFIYADHVSISYYADDNYQSHPESQLFSTENELKDYIFNPRLEEFV